MKKFFALILLCMLLFSCVVGVHAESLEIETPDTSIEIVEEETIEPTAVPAVDQLINFLFDGKVTISKLIEYIVVAFTAIFSVAYNRYKKSFILKDKQLSKTDIEIEDLKAANKDMSNQLGLLGNMIVCAYLSNNLVDPELKKKLATYAEELMKGTNINQDKLTERLIQIAQNPTYQQKVSEIKEEIIKEAKESQDVVQNMKDNIAILVEEITQDITKEEPQASDVIDNLKIEV